MKRADIIARRRKFVIPGYGYKTLADVGFDGEWVTPYQKISNSKTGPLLVAKDWLDWPSVAEHRDVLKQKGYLPHMRFNQVVDLALEKAGLKRNDIYVTQAFHLLPQGRSEPIPRRHIDESFDRITRHEVDGRTVIDLGEPAAAACRRAGVECIECIHPSARGKTVESKAEELAEALVAKLARTKETRKMEISENQEGSEAVMYDYDALRELLAQDDGVLVDAAMEKLHYNEAQVRGMIDRLRAKGVGITNIGYRRFQLGGPGTRPRNR